MARKIQIDIEVNGKMQKATVDAKKLRDQLGGIDEGMDDVSKSAREADRNIKGTAQASSNASKNFSKMQQGMGGLVGAYASLAASLFAVSAAFNFLKSAGELKSLQAGQVAYASATGVAMKTLTNDIIEATEAQIQFRDAAQATAIGTAAGLNADQLTRLAVAAKDASQILGRDVTDSFNRLIRGATKAELELLDELGIILRLDDATQKYKTALNITGRELTAFERTQAVTNDILAQSEEKYSRILDIVGRSPNQYAQLGKAFDDIIMKVKDVVDQIVGPFAKVLQDTPALGVAALGLLVSGPLKALGFSFAGIAVAAQDAADKQREFYQGVRKEVQHARKSADDFKRDLQGLARVGIADGGKAGFLDKMAAGKTLNKADIARFTKAVDAAEKHVNSSGVVIKGAFTGMKIHMVREMREAYMNMDAAQAGTLAKTETFGLRMKAVFAGIKASAVSMGATIATAGTKLLNIIGFASMAYSIVKVFQGMGDADAPLTDAELQAKNIEKLSRKVRSLNEEFSTFIDVQNELNRPGSNKFFQSIGDFLGANSAREIGDMVGELEKLQGTIGKTQRTFSDYAKIAAASVAGGFTGLMLFNPATALAGAVLGGAAEYADQEYNLTGGREGFAENRRRDATDKGFRKRFKDIQDTLKAAVKETKTNYQAFIDLDQAIDKSLRDPGNEELKQALIESYAAAITFAGGLKAVEERAKKIRTLSKDLFQSFGEGTQADSTASLVREQIAELKKEEKALASTFENRLDAGYDTGSMSSMNAKRQAEITDELTEQEKLLEDLTKLGAIEFDQKERALRTQLKMVKGTEGMTGAQRKLNDLQNQELTLQQKKADIQDQQAQAEIAARRAMMDANRGRPDDEQFTMETFLASQEGLVFARRNVLLELELEVNEQNLTQVEGQIDTAIHGVIADAEKHELKLGMQQLQFAQQLAGLKQKELQAQRAMLQLQKQQDDAAIDAAMREERLKNPFYYIDEDRRRAQLELDTANKRKQTMIDAINAERDIKIKIMALEGQMLRERRNIALLELRAAQAGLPEDSEVRAQIGQEITQMEGQTPAFEQALADAEAAQRTAANAEAQAQKEAVEENIKKKEYQVELTNELRLAMEDAAQSMEDGFTNAFAAMIDGSMNAKEAFRAMAESMLQEISRIIARLLVQKAIMMAMNMIGNMIAPGAGTVATASMSVGQAATASAGASGSAGIDAMINSIANSGRYGGVMKKGYSAGGIARGSDAGYLAKLHGTEAVVPLPNGRSIPVEMSGGGAQTNNVSVNVNVNNDGTAETTSEGDSREMGRAIAAAVQREIQTQKRPGGLLSPYGSR